MKTIVKVEIQTYQITYMNGVLYMESGDRALVRDIRSARRNRVRQCSRYKLGSADRTLAQKIQP